MRKSIQLAIGAVLLCLLGSPVPGVAQADGYESSIESYFQNTWGVTDSVTTLHVASTSTCPAGQSCTGGSVALVNYSEGDGAGQAIMVVYPDQKCPSCYTTLLAGGGVIDIPGIEALGFTPAEASYLVNN